MAGRLLTSANLLVVFLAVMVPSGRVAYAQHGLVLSGVGPINRSMGGASVAAPLDASGAIHWNPATITALKTSEVEWGLELLYPQARLLSKVSAGALGPGFPPSTLAGSNRSNEGVFPLPTLGAVYKPAGSRWSYGLGAFAVGGFAVSFPGSQTNPILTPQPPHGLGMGAVSSELQVMQVVPTASCKITKRLSIGVAPTLSLARLAVDPALFAAPDDSNGDGFPGYPLGKHSRYHWGAGIQGGILFELDEGLNLGFSIKSPQWFETFRFNSSDELGRPQMLEFNFDYPMILSVGAAYSGFKRWLFATDIRFIDYSNTDGLRSASFDSRGAVTGLGWNSIVAIAAGVQHRILDGLSFRVGYTYNQNPIDDARTSFNIASPLVLQHTLYSGASYQMKGNLLVSLAYAHAFDNLISGHIVGVSGPIPGTQVAGGISADTAMLGVSVRF